MRDDDGLEFHPSWGSRWTTRDPKPPPKDVLAAPTTSPHPSPETSDATPPVCIGLLSATTVINNQIPVFLHTDSVTPGWAAVNLVSEPIDSGRPASDAKDYTIRVELGTVNECIGYLESRVGLCIASCIGKLLANGKIRLEAMIKRGRRNVSSSLLVETI